MPFRICFPFLALLFFSFLSFAGSRRDTIYSSAGDTMIVRKFSHKKVRSEKHYVKNKLQYTRRFSYESKWYGYLTKTAEANKHQLAPFKNFWKNGSLRMSGTTLDGKLTGAFLTFYPNGKSQCTCNYIMGKREGRQIFRYDNGQLGSEIIYRNGIPWSIEKNFNKDGSRGQDGTLKDGNGTFFIYDKREKVKRIDHYRGGILTKKENFKS